MDSQKLTPDAVWTGEPRTREWDVTKYNGFLVPSPRKDREKDPRNYIKLNDEEWAILREKYAEQGEHALEFFELCVSSRLLQFHASLGEETIGLPFNEKCKVFIEHITAVQNNSSSLEEVEW